jgi:hypothetical protein
VEKTRQAKELLKKHGIKSIKPIQLAKASQQINKSLLETLKLIAFMKSGQGYGPSPHTQRALMGKFL